MRSFGGSITSGYESSDRIQGNDNLSTKKYYLFSNVHTKSIRNRALQSLQQQKNQKIFEKNLISKKDSFSLFKQLKEEPVLVENKNDTSISLLTHPQLQW